MRPSAWDQPDMACVPCRGRGWIITEDASGAPGREVRCPYCKGRQNTWWVTPNRRKRMRRGNVIIAAIPLWLTWNLWPHRLLFVPITIAAVLALAWFWFPRVPSWVPRRRPHAPGFNTSREAKYAAGYGAAVGLRSMWDQHEKGR